MKIEGARTILTGASGGIGQALARELANHRARLALVGRQEERLASLAKELQAMGCDAIPVIADLTCKNGRDGLVEQMQKQFDGTDILINNAGMSAFCSFVQTDPEVEEQIFRTNVLAPMQLTRAILPGMIEQGAGRIVNIGSTFGSIAFACFSSYSASKFALRGFSEGLRRELDGSGVGVTYIAPRAVNTELNTAAVKQMAERVKMNMDEPSSVAKQIVQVIEKDRKERYLGFPESLFVRLNALFPRLVDSALRNQNRVMQTFTPQHPK